MPRLTVTYVLAAVTALAGLFFAAQGTETLAAYGAGFIPARLMGVPFDPALPAVPAWLTPLTATLVHGGLMHLLFNLVMLLFAGRETERVIGPGPTLLLYAVGAYAAAFAQWLPDPWAETPMVGASGAISAFVGAYALYYSRRRARAIGPIPEALVQILWLTAAWTAINFLFAWAMSEPGFEIAWQAHVGGFVAGLVLARPLLWWRWRGA